MITALSHMIVSAAKAHPEREAFRYGTYALNYGELNYKTDQLSKHLISKGVKKGDRVGVYLFRSIETAIAIYGIMKSGAAFVPIDPALPIDRITFLLNDCGIEHVVTNPNLGKKHRKILEHETPLKSIIGAVLETRIPIISWEEVFKISLEDYREVVLSENDLAYVMYTSGSTGFPKGIMHTHKSGLSYARLSVNLFNIQKEDRLASHAPLHFDISTLGYLSGPFAAATTVIISEAHTKMATSLAELIDKEKITIWYSVPLALVQLLQSNTVQEKDLSALRLVLFGGEVFPNKYLNQLMSLCPKVGYHNIYGPAEVNQCTSFELKMPPAEREVVPIGKVWEETEYRILDQTRHSTSNLHSGELAISSSTMMLGYWNNKALTEKSIYREKSADGEKLFFKTGDMVKENENGDLIFLGRNDRQVKVRGYRIEIDEIEAAILKHKDVLESAVVVIDKSESEKEIMAAVILNNDNDVEIEVKDILAHCRSLLPVYAVPQSIELMHDFPRTGSGKIDRNEIVKIYIKA